MSWLIRWWVHRNLSTVLPPRLLGGLLAAVVLTISLGAVVARLPNQPSPSWAAEQTTPTAPTPPRTTPPTTPPASEPGRTNPEPQGVAPQPSPPRWLADPTGDFVGWALLATVDGARGIAGSQNMTERSTTASMIKVWIAADYLRRTAEAGDEPSPTRLAQLTEVIRDSDNAYAQEIFVELGSHESIERLIDICGLPTARAFPYRWSNTQLSPIDAVLMGACIADGRAAGPEWTKWLLDEMRLVRGVGDFGIRDALPPEQRSAVAIKNGWVVRADQEAWHVNCLAIGDEWTMAVMTRYPADLGYQHGAEICRSLAAEHLPTATDQIDTQPDPPPSPS